MVDHFGQTARFDSEPTTWKKDGGFVGWVCGIGDGYRPHTIPLPLHSPDDPSSRVWNNYIRSPRSKPANIFVLDVILEEDLDYSELKQWNELHASE